MMMQAPGQALPRRACFQSRALGPKPQLRRIVAQAGCHEQVSMDDSLTRLQAFEAYSRELQQPAEKVDLLMCAALIARATKYPHLQVSEVVSQVDKLAAEVQKQLPQGQMYPLQILKTIISVMYHQKGFHGNTVEFYDPDNSFINMVLVNKAGIPITLSLLFMEVAKRVNFPMKGVNLPAHFMIQPDVEGLELLVDAFAGEVVFVEDAAAKLSQLMDREVRLDATILTGKGVPPRHFLMRLLNNLKQIYLMTNNIDLALRVIRLMRVTRPEVTSELRDEGVCLYGMARYREAADLLNQYIQSNPKGDDVLMVSTMIEGCKVLMKEQQEQLEASRQQQQQEQLEASRQQQQQEQQ